MSGLDAVRAIRASRRATSRSSRSAPRVMPGDRERALEAGCDDFVAKPIDDLLLVELVGRLLERR